MSKKLESYGFEVNPYNPCVMNTDVKGRQMIVTWHVGNLKVSHMDPSELKKIGQYLRDNFGDIFPEHTGYIHDYLGIDLDYSTKGKFKVSMIKYLHKLLTGFLEYWTLGNAVATLA